MAGARFAAKVLRSACLGFLLISTLDAAFATGADDTSKAGDCLSGPKGTAPAGERWRYRVERGTKRHCWYTRADGQPKTVAKRTQTVRPLKDADMLDAEPLQLSVANARAEADLSAPPPPIETRDVQTVAETRNPAWTLAERWAQNSDGSPAVQAPPAPTRQPITLLPVQMPDAAEAANPDSNLLEMAAGTVALLGLSVVLTATLIRRRKRDRPIRDWPSARPDVDDEPVAPLTDLNDEPLLTWRKAPKERLRIMRRSAELREATNVRMARPRV